jgi:hypothetical protein
MKAEQANLQMLANKANATWVEAHQARKGGPRFGPPTVLDPHVLTAGGVDVDMYKQVCVRVGGGRARVLNVHASCASVPACVG